MFVYQHTNVVCVMYTVYCILCTVYCVPCTVYRVLCTVYCVPCTVYRVLCTVLCAVYCVLCSLCTASAQPLHSLCAATVQPLYSLCIAPAQPLHNPCAASAQPLHDKDCSTADKLCTLCMTKFADKLCDKLHDKICRQSLSTAADEYLTFWFLCIFLVSATHTKTSRAYIQLAVEGFPFCRSHLQVPASSVCIARTHASTDGRVHAPHRCQEIGRMALRHAGT